LDHFTVLACNSFPLFFSVLCAPRACLHAEDPTLPPIQVLSEKEIHKRRYGLLKKHQERQLIDGLRKSDKNGV
jgi:putative ribosome biogenesis GTPase RsgA